MRNPGAMAKQVLQSLFRKPATLNYPADKKGMPKGFRGRLVFYRERCVGCKLCMKDCPAGAIEIVKVGEKQFEAKVDLAKCIYCGQCVASCNKDALLMSEEFELAALTKDKLRVVLEPGPAVAPSRPADPPLSGTPPPPPAPPHPTVASKEKPQDPPAPADHGSV